MALSKKYLLIICVFATGITFTVTGAPAAIAGNSRPVDASQILQASCQAMKKSTSYTADGVASMKSGSIVHLEKSLTNEKYNTVFAGGAIQSSIFTPSSIYFEANQAGWLKYFQSSSSTARTMASQLQGQWIDETASASQQSAKIQAAAKQFSQQAPTQRKYVATEDPVTELCSSWMKQASKVFSISKHQLAGVPIYRLSARQNGQSIQVDVQQSKTPFLVHISLGGSGQKIKWAVTGVNSTPNVAAPDGAVPIWTALQRPPS